MPAHRTAKQQNTIILRNFLFTVGIAGLLFLLGFFPHWVETIYSNGFYQVTSVVQRFISGLLPFALGDFLYLILLVYVLVRIFQFLRKLFKKQLKKSFRWQAPLQTLQFLLFLYIIFKLSWGLNYSRLPIAASLGISNQKYTQPELLALGTFLIQKVNTLHPKRAKNPIWTIQQLEQQATAAYQNVAKNHSFFNYIAPAVKPVLFSEIITRSGIEGYYNPLSGEANVNMHLPPTGQAFVSCHEIAHQLGIGREDEANLIGYIAAIHSDNLEFQYSGYYAMLRSVMVEIGKSMPEIYDTLYYTVNKRTISEFERDRAFWLKYNSEMYAYMDISFDKFLKLNNQQKGTESYQDIVLWLYNYHKIDLAGTKTAP